MVFSSASVPPARDLEVRRWAIDNPAELRALRASLAGAIPAVPAEAVEAMDDTIQKMQIVVTELATNALRHGAPPTTVRLCRSAQHYIIDVIDGDPSTSPLDAQQTPLALSGRGLFLARALALDVDWCVTPTDKHVWARFPAPLLNDS